MANSTPNPSDVFDVRKVRRLVELMNEYDLNALDLQQGDQRIRLRRGAETVETVVATPAVVAAPVAAAPAAPASPAESSIAASNPNEVEITSPMVGSFYTAANPDAAAFVKIGDQVGPETTVCIVEAMKVFNQIPADVTGRIVAVLVENGESIEYGQPLFRVDTSQ